jgi:hypothetical protein
LSLSFCPFGASLQPRASVKTTMRGMHFISAGLIQQGFQRRCVLSAESESGRITILSPGESPVRTTVSFISVWSWSVGSVEVLEWQPDSNRNKIPVSTTFMTPVYSIAASSLPAQGVPFYPPLCSCRLPSALTSVCHCQSNTGYRPAYIIFLFLILFGEGQLFLNVYLSYQTA